jgi:hypothetical protein
MIAKQPFAAYRVRGERTSAGQIEGCEGAFRLAREEPIGARRRESMGRLETEYT